MCGATFGPLGAQVFSGDWDGDGHDGMGVYNAADGAISLHNDPTTSDYSDVDLTYGVTNGIPLAGRWSVTTKR